MQESDRYRYGYIEEKLNKLLDSVDGIFLDIEKKEVQEFIEVGEYGLALETFLDIINEEGRIVSDSVRTIVNELQIIMNATD